MDDWILHVDLDQFLAAVEVLRRPELAGRPVVVGGDGNPNRPRQVVATASYEARAFGVRSGMPLRPCRPQVSRRGVPPLGPPGLRRGVVPGDGDVAVVPGDRGGVGLGRSVRGRPHRRPGVVRPASCKARVLAETGLTCAVGIGETKLQAKTATGFAKPGGVARLTRRTWIETMGDRPVTALWGVGGRTASRLADSGIHTVVELAGADHRRAGPTVRSDDRAVPQDARARRRRLAGRGRAACAPVAEPRGDVRARPHEPDRDRRTRRPPGRRGDRVGGRRGTVA